jgi:tRNA dimethylallyltransferase
VPHHLIDVLDLAEGFDAARFVQLANAAIGEVQARGRLPILCGGTGLYFKAVLEGLGQAPRSDAGLRAQLEATPLADLLAELAVHDPVSYETIDRQNPRRVIRAIEVLRLSGRPFSEQRALWSARHASPSFPHMFFSLNRRVAELNHRIQARVDSMFKSGLVAETEELLKRGLADNRTAAQALGYKQVIEHLRGQRPLADTIELVKIRTRQFAKRQLTWFRRQLSPTWVRMESGQSPDLVADILERNLRKPQAEGSN